MFLLHLANNETYFSNFLNVFGLVSTTEVPEIVQLVFNMELLAISNMFEDRSEHKVFVRASLKLKKVF